MVSSRNILPLQLTNYQADGQYKPKEPIKTETMTSFTPLKNEEKETSKPESFDEPNFSKADFIPLELAINDYLKETVLIRKLLLRCYTRFTNESIFYHFLIKIRPKLKAIDSGVLVKDVDSEKTDMDELMKEVQELGDAMRLLKAYLRL